MVVKFVKNGRKFQGEVISQGFYKVDAPECYEIHIGSVIVYIPITECKIVN